MDGKVIGLYFLLLGTSGLVNAIYFGKDHERRQRIYHPWQLSQDQRWRSSKIFSHYDIHGKYYKWLSDEPLHYDLDINPVLSRFETNADARQRIPQTFEEFENREYNNRKKITATAPLKVKTDIDSDITASNFFLKEDSSSELPMVKVGDSRHSDILPDSMTYIPEATRVYLLKDYLVKKDSSSELPTVKVRDGRHSDILPNSMTYIPQATRVYLLKDYLLKKDSSSELPTVKVGDSRHSDSMTYIPQAIRDNSENPVTQNVESKVSYVLNAEPNSPVSETSSTDKETLPTPKIMKNLTSPEINSFNSVLPITISGVVKPRDSSPTSNPGSSSSDEREMHSANSIASTTERIFSDVEDIRSTTTTTSNTESTSSNGEEMQSTTITASESTSSDGEKIQSTTITASESSSSDGEEMQSTTTTASNSESTDGEEVQSITITASNSESTSSDGKEIQSTTIALTEESTTLNPVSSTVDKDFTVSAPEKEFTDGNVAISSNSGSTESSKSEYVTKSISEDHVIRISSIKTARMIVTIVFLVIALVAVAILAVYIFRTRRKAAHYDQLLLLP